MAFFDSFTDSLKQKWLQFFQSNRDWIMLHMTAESVYTPDGGKRPSSYLILGVVNALEPKLAQLMFPFAKLNPDADTLIEVLDLNFDPDIVLGNRVSPLVEPETFSNQPTLILEDKNSVEESFASAEINSFQEEKITQQYELAGNSGSEWNESASLTEDDSFGAMSLSDESEDNAFGNVSFEDAEDESGFGNVTGSEEAAFGEIAGLDENGFGDLTGSEEAAFGEIAGLDETGFGDLTGSEETAFEIAALNDDLWSDETSQTNELEELPPDFNESEMARLFPNS